MSKEWIDANIDLLTKFQNLISFYQGENHLDFYLSDVQGNRIHLESIDRVLQNSPITLDDLLTFVTTYGTVKPLLAWIHRELFLKGDPFVLAGIVMLMEIADFSISLQTDFSVTFRYKFLQENLDGYPPVTPLHGIRLNRSTQDVHYLIDFDDLVELLDTMNMTPLDLRNLALLHCHTSRKLSNDGQKMICTLLMQEPLDGTTAKWRTQKMASGGFYSNANTNTIVINSNTTGYTTTTAPIFYNTTNPIATNRIVSGKLDDSDPSYDAFDHRII